VQGFEIKQGDKQGSWSLTSGGLCRAKCYGEVQAKNGSVGGEMCTGLKKEKAGAKGGEKRGDTKRRFGVHNNRTKLDIDTPSTWKTFGLSFPKFQYLLKKLHYGRENALPRPYLRKSELPSWVTSGLEDVDKILKVMNGTKFGNPDRYKDRVSREILKSMGKAKKRVQKIAISLAVRFSGNVKGSGSQGGRLTPYRSLYLQQKQSMLSVQEEDHLFPPEKDTFLCVKGALFLFRI